MPSLSEHLNRSSMSPYLMCSSLFQTAVMVMKVHIGDITPPSTLRENDLPLLELLSSGPNAHVRLGNNCNDLG